jgi:hypothetical protein
MSWYDNEWGFSNRMADTAVAMGKLLVSFERVHYSIYFDRRTIFLFVAVESYGKDGAWSPFIL